MALDFGDFQNLFSKRFEVERKNIKRSLFINPQSIQVESPATLEFGATSTHPTIKMPDSLASSIYMNFLLPENMVGDTIEIILYWYANTSSGNINLTTDIFRGRRSKIITDNPLTITGQIKATSGTNKMNVTSIKDSLGLKEFGSYKDGDLLGIEIDRNGNLGTDTLNVDMFVIGVEIVYFGQ